MTISTLRTKNFVRKLLSRRDQSWSHDKHMDFKYWGKSATKWQYKDFWQRTVSTNFWATVATASVTPNIQFEKAVAKVLRNGNTDFADKELCPQTFEPPWLRLESCQTHGNHNLRKECYKMAIRRFWRKNFVHRLLSHGDHCQSHTKRTVVKNYGKSAKKWQ